jgi:hypothetical protein
VGVEKVGVGLDVWGVNPAVDLVGGPFLAPMQWQVSVVSLSGRGTGPIV